MPYVRARQPRPQSPVAGGPKHTSSTPLPLHGHATSVATHPGAASVPGGAVWRAMRQSGLAGCAQQRETCHATAPLWSGLACQKRLTHPCDTPCPTNTCSYHVHTSIAHKEPRRAVAHIDKPAPWTRHFQRPLLPNKRAIPKQSEPLVYQELCLCIAVKRAGVHPLIQHNARDRAASTFRSTECSCFTRSSFRTGRPDPGEVESNVLRIGNWGNARSNHGRQLDFTSYTTAAHNAPVSTTRVAQPDQHD